jgi:hypothetical protein
LELHLPLQVWGLGFRYAQGLGMRRV